ncbi:DUF4270 family protein [Flavobacterium taihuense]|uniref:DUF4270 domain-containing protein n=1 Tax=Flavobacterium taihuense TaxID=2857508 RepID=A0ABS6XUQ9_9FLAO|nr:DUF4270 family protein [Flavobacterium taihuense]MBW4359599.1 DUF4270 domain-containing protein [Flavobacterium taihuense]
MYKFLFLMFLSLLMISCDSDADVGEFLVGADYLAIKNKVISIDTVTVEVSTIKLDSLVTSGASRILVGNYDDPIFGKVKADSYFQVSTTAFNLYSQNSDTDATGYVFDSIAMILRYDDYYYADTTKVQTLNIHRVIKKFKPNVNDASFYNNSSLNYDDPSLGTITYKPKPIGRDSINIKVDNEFGMELFNKLKNNEITTSSEFTEYLKGFVLKSSTNASAGIIGFNMLSVLRLYYSKGTGDTEDTYKKDFTILDVSKQFNAISSDRAGTLIQDLPLSKMNLSSLYTGNAGFIQSGTGIVCRVDFPNIKQLKYLSEKGAIVDAKLIMKPVKNSYSEMFPLPEKLSVYVVDKLNRIKATLTNSSGENSVAILNNTNDEFDESVNYELSLGSFLQKEMLKESDSKSGLLFTLPTLSKIVDRVALGDQTNKENKMKLQIYYITY